MEWISFLVAQTDGGRSYGRQAELVPRPAALLMFRCFRHLSTHSTRVHVHNATSTGIYVLSILVVHSSPSRSRTQAVYLAVYAAQSLDQEVAVHVKMFSKQSCR